MNHEDFTNFVHPGLSFTVQALQLPSAKHTSLTSTTKTHVQQISVTREAFSKTCLFTKQPFQSYMDVTALSFSLCIQELMLQNPRDVFLCRCQGNKLNSVSLECSSIHHRGYFVINVLALYDGKISYI